MCCAPHEKDRRAVFRRGQCQRNGRFAHWRVALCNRRIVLAERLCEPVEKRTGQLSTAPPAATQAFHPSAIEVTSA
jgi:hypothetical protein